MNHSLKIFNKKSLLKTLLILPFFTSPFLSQINSTKALEFQWDKNNGYKSLKYYQRNPRKNSKNKIFLFFRPSERKTGLLNIDIKIPQNFKSTLKPKNISFCKAKIGGFSSKTKCLENIPSDVEIDNETKKVTIYPISPVPSSKDVYAVVFKIVNPQKAGLYQFHSFGKSSGAIPVSIYLGSWTLRVDQQ